MAQKSTSTKTSSSAGVRPRVNTPEITDTDDLFLPGVRKITVPNVPPTIGFNIRVVPHVSRCPIFEAPRSIQLDEDTVAIVASHLESVEIVGGRPIIRTPSSGLELVNFRAEEGQGALGVIRPKPAGCSVNKMRKY